MQTSPSESFTEYSFYLFFLVALVTQIFLPCFLGNEMIFASNDLINSAYNSSWHVRSIGYRKLLIILMERLKRRSSILVGKLFPLSLDTFSSVNVFYLNIIVCRIWFTLFRLYTSRIAYLRSLAIQNKLKLFDEFSYIFNV